MEDAFHSFRTQKLVPSFLFLEHLTTSHGCSEIYIYMYIFSPQHFHFHFHFLLHQPTHRRSFDDTLQQQIYVNMTK
jgi:hypothetical protein